MATKTATPSANASRQRWVDYFADVYPDVDTDDMTRQDMRDLHKLRKAAAAEVRDVEPAADTATATPSYSYAPPSLDDVPEDMRFSSVDPDAETRELERIPFAVDDYAFWLYQVPDTALRLYSNQLLSDDVQAATNAMVMIVQHSVDPVAMKYLQDRIVEKSNDFDEGLYGRIVMAVLNEWGDDMAQRAGEAADKATAKNRAQRREAARKRKSSQK